LGSILPGTVLRGSSKLNMSPGLFRLCNYQAQLCRKLQGGKPENQSCILTANPMAINGAQAYLPQT